MGGSGKCLCGAVRFEAQDVDPHVHACHCSMCRHWNGGPALAVSVGSVTFTGDENIGRFASSDWAERGFCKECGSNLFYFLKIEPSRYIMWAGSFDKQDFEFGGEIFCADKASWYDFSGDHPRHAALPG
jgi:hypothetical protein